MKLSRITTLISMFLAVILCAPAYAASPDAHSALPGALNYVEGQASIAGNTLNGNSVGSTTLQPGETLETGKGKAEILLTPGVFLRVDENSAVKMVSPSITNTEVQLDQGRAMVEVAEIHDQNNLRVSEDGVQSRLVKKGLYEFDAGKQQVLVFDGKADVQEGDRTVEVKGGHELTLNTGEKPKTHSFDKGEYKQSDLYQWSSLRSSYLAEANASTAQVYLSNGYFGPGWFGPGWYWAPGFGSYTFIPGNGVLYSPFGWGFYSPLVVYRAPWRYGYTRVPYGWVRGPAYVTGVRPGVNAYTRSPQVGHAPAFRSAPVVHAAPAFHGGFGHGGFTGGHMTGTRH